MNLAGEALPGTLVEAIYAGSAVERVLNLYGPSEDATYSTWAVIGRGTASPSIGYPVPGTRAYVLDRWGEPAPLGVLSELYLGGAGLARGYLGRPELTAERFVPDPFGEPGGRLYRTGDLVRRRVSGELNFVGRVDHQVKVRGFRIELGEIESRLREHAGVSECAVLALGDRLLACVVGTDLSMGDLRDHMSRRVPGPMVPSSWVLLPSLPLSATGKVDRRALARLGTELPVGPDLVVPRAGVEEVLAGLWSEVLGLERVSAQASFFELGGHSLLATRVMSRVREAFGVELPLRSLFDSPTVAGLARTIEASLGVSSPALPPIRPLPRGGDLPLSFAQERVWLFDQLDPDGAANNIPAALAFRGALVAAVLARCLAEVVRRHEALRTTIVLADGRPIQRVAPPCPLDLPVVDLGALPPACRQREAYRLRHAEARRSFRLEIGPLLRTVLVRLSEREHELLLTVHHIVSDGWSLGVLAQEIAFLYEAFSAGRPSPLESLPIQYGDFCIWQRQWMEERVFDEQLDYWKRQLGSGSPVLELPTDRPRPPVRSSHGAGRSRALSTALTGALDAMALAAGATRFMVLGAAFTALLHRVTGQEEIRFGTFVANRNHLEVERLIGFFVNDLVLSVEVASRDSFRSLIGLVRGVALEAYAHQDLPFERLLAELQPERSLSYTPLFQVMLVLQNMPTPVLELPDLELSRLPIGNERSKRRTRSGSRTCAAPVGRRPRCLRRWSARGRCEHFCSVAP